MTFTFLFTFAILASSSFGFPRDDELFESLNAPHIAGGQEVKPYSIPHQVALLVEKFNSLIYTCGGSLIAPQWVLTAAHCVEEKSYTFKAMMGVHNISKPEKTAWTAQVKEIFLNENYDPKLNIHDIALLKLKNSVPVNGKTINTIRLPSVSQRGTYFVWSKATLSGWGRLKDQYSPNSPVLRSVEARIWWGPICKLYFWLNGRGKHFKSETHICTSGWWKKGGCFGDSGGPLTIEESDGQRTLVGVFAYIYDYNCEKSGPTAFTRVSEYLDWIHNVTDISLRP